MAEIELSVLSSQALAERLGSLPALQERLVARRSRRNAVRGSVHWQFTTTDARTKLRHLYPKTLPW